MSLKRSVGMIALLISFLTFIGMAAVYIGSSKITIGGQEQDVIFAVQALLNGQPLYRDPNHFPFIVTQYTPIFFELCLAVSRVFALKSADLHSIYLVGRMTSGVASICTSFVLYDLLSRYAALDKIMRLALALMLPLAVGLWAFAARPDALYLFFVVAGLSAALSYAASGRLGMLVLCNVLLLAGFYTKQTALFMFPLPLIVCFARQGWQAFRWQNILVCTVVYGIGTCFMTPMMSRNFTVGLANGLDFAAAWRNVYLPVGLHRLPWLIAAGVAVHRAAKGTDWRLRAIALVTLWFLIIGAGLAIKWGSSDNYLDEFIVGCLLLVVMAPCLASEGRVPRQDATAFVMLCLIVVGQVTAIYFSKPTLWSARASSPELYDSGYALAAAPEIEAQHVIALDVTSLIFIPKRAVFTPIEVVGSAVASGNFDLTPVIQAVRAGDICFAVTDQAMLKRVRSDQPMGKAGDLSIDSVARTVLADFHFVRQIGRKQLFASNFCNPATRTK